MSKSTQKTTINEEIEAIRRRMANGEEVAVDPDIADAMGAFSEDAISPEDALESRFDHEEGMTDETNNEGEQ